METEEDHFGGKVIKPRSEKQLSADRKLRWLVYKRARVEELKSFQDDFRHEVNIDPFIDELAPDPLIDELKIPPLMLRTTRGDYMPHAIWDKIITTKK